METREQIAWLERWCAEQGLNLVLEGECGFGRDCVGVASMDESGTYPDYQWYDKDYEDISGSGGVWTPEDAYHKHPCTAVLGRGDVAIAQLYEWCVWFEENGFVYERTRAEGIIDPIDLMLGRDFHHRMVRRPLKKMFDKVLK
jgi:hypothetical protein